MQISAEIRWFWQHFPPVKLWKWFSDVAEHACPPGGGTSRIDEYLGDYNQIELGIKRRGGKPGVEIKGLVAPIWSSLGSGPFLGSIELWTKWISEALELNGELIIPVNKIRWLRKFDTTSPVPKEVQLDCNEKPLDRSVLPNLGCNVELTQITLQGGQIWWTLGFESFGTVQTVAKDLEAVAQLLAKRHAPELGAGMLASYPAWLKQHPWDLR